VTDVTALLAWLRRRERERAYLLADDKVRVTGEPAVHRAVHADRRWRRDRRRPELTDASPPPKAPSGFDG